MITVAVSGASSICAGTRLPALSSGDGPLVQRPVQRQVQQSAVLRFSATVFLGLNGKLTLTAGVR